ncbi:MAG: hypothetical protein ABIF10_06440 [Candidatus Woesearchaeota archaeon]
MATDVDIRKDIEEIKKSLDYIKNILAEEYELSDAAKKKLEIARKTPISQYVDHADIKKRLLG